MKHRLVVLVSLSVLTLLTLLTLPGGPAFAHHSATATYIQEKTVKIDGTLKEFVWRNPHSFMKVQAPDEKGEMQTWVIETAAAAVFAEQGVTTSTLRPGDHLIVTGQPGRIAEDHRLHLQTVERPSDGFKWRRPEA